MKKTGVSVLVLLGLQWFSAMAQAEGISYSYFDLKLGYGDVDTGAFLGSVSVTDNVYLKAGYEKTRGFSPELTAKGVGVGFHIPVSGDSDAYFEYGRGSVDGTGVDGDVDTIEIGVRSMLSDDLEINGSWSRADTTVAVSGYSVTGYAYGPAVGVVYGVNEMLAVTGEIDRVGDDTTTLLGLRINF